MAMRLSLPDIDAGCLGDSQIRTVSDRDGVRAASQRRQRCRNDGGEGP
jgi:hypothetical protein